MSNICEPTKLFIHFMKLPFRLISQFCYRNLQTRNRENALSYIHSCKHINSVLKTDQEIEQSLQNLKKLKLRPHIDRPKNWDTYRTFSYILNHGSTNSKILDVGCADYGVILPWFKLYKFSNLYGCDISFEKNFQKGRIHYYKQDLQKTNFPSNYFNFITSISVIEHGVKLNAYLKEMNRLLKDGGYLLTSTDYWPDSINTKKIYPYGEELGEMKIFTREDIEELIQIAQAYDLELIEPIDWKYKDKVVHWKRVGKRFTYIFFILRKK